MTITISEKFDEISDDILQQIATLRWGYNKEKVNAWANTMKTDRFGFTSFYAFAIIENKVIGFAYFCQDEDNEDNWYYGDLVVHDEHRRQGVAVEIVKTAMQFLKNKKALRLFTYIDNDNQASMLLHEKMSFFQSDTQESVNGFDFSGRIVYECALEVGEGH